MRATITSVQYQYGNLEKRTPKFWGHVTKQDWDSAIKELRDFGDDYGKRRNREADLLESAVKQE